MTYNKVIIYRSMPKSEGDSFKLQPIVLRVPADQDSITLTVEKKGN